MTGVPGQGHQLSLYSKVFEDKVAQESKNQFNGSSDSGPTWRIFTRNYLMGTMPEVKALLKWAEERQHAKIEYDDLIALNETRMLDNCAVVMSHHVWRYLNLNLTGGAKTIHTNTDESNGLEVWRKLTLDITSRSAARRKLLHDQVYNPKHIGSLPAVKMAIEHWEAFVTQYEDAGGTAPDDGMRQVLLVGMLPE